VLKKGDPRTKAIAQKGAAASVAARKSRVVASGPYTGTILDVMDAAQMIGASWEPWRVWVRWVFGLAKSAHDLNFGRQYTERQSPPPGQVSEAWLLMGRRAGKSNIKAVVALFLAIRFDGSRLSPGELALVPVLAADRQQARVVFGYLKGLCQRPEFSPFVRKITKESIELTTSVTIEIGTASWRTTRGYTCVGVICDEIAFWRTDDGSANPDSEILAALRPAMATVPDALLLGGSTPYAAKGELYKAVDRYFGQDAKRVLVWNADTRSMNPSIPAELVERAFEEDATIAGSEYGRDGRVQFRRDVEAFLDAAAIREVTVEGRRELPPLRGVRYRAFVDPSGGSQDSFTIAIAHRDGDKAVLDTVRERRPPFSPDAVAEEYAALIRTYGMFSVTGDRYAGQWVVEAFARHGIRLQHSDQSKSDLYRELVAPVNAGRVELLDLPALRAQLAGLERRVARGGKDSVDHAPGGRDDIANAVAGAVVNVLPASRSGKPQVKVW
jgi:hypothetical protein